MKRKWICLFLCALLFLQVVPVSAAGLPKVVDEGGLLTASEEADLAQKAQNVTDRYQTDVVIVTVPSLGGKSSESYADDYYDYNGYGVGSDNSGVLLLIAIEDREWAISTCGETIDRLADDISDLFSVMEDDLADGNYYRAFDAYLDALPRYLNDSVNWGLRLLVALLIGAAAAGIVILVMRGQMNTVKAQHGAEMYVKQGSYYLRRQQDIFLYSHVTKTSRQTSSGGGHGGGASHTSSSGTHHGGGHGHF